MIYLLYFAFLLPTLETLTIPPSHNEASPIPPLQQDVNDISGNETLIVLRSVFTSFH